MRSTMDRLQFSSSGFLAAKPSRTAATSVGVACCDAGLEAAASDAPELAPGAAPELGGGTGLNGTSVGNEAVSGVATLGAEEEGVGLSWLPKTLERMVENRLMVQEGLETSYNCDFGR